MFVFLGRLYNAFFEPGDRIQWFWDITEQQEVFNFLRGWWLYSGQKSLLDSLEDGFPMRKREIMEETIALPYLRRWHP